MLAVLLGAALGLGCEGSRVEAGDENTDVPEATATEAGAGVCGPDDDTPEVRTSCVLGESIDGQQELRADGPISFRLDPEGCYATGCTEILISSCAFVERSGPDLELEGDFCLRETGLCPIPDCFEDAAATCKLVDGELPEGDYSVSVDELVVEFSVPSTFIDNCASR